MTGTVRQLFCLLIVAAASAAALPAIGAEVVRWVDADGVTHFGERQFAPSEHTPVDIAPANGMVPAQYPGGRTESGPTVIHLERPSMENKRGFRGFDNRPSRSQREYRRRH